MPVFTTSSVRPRQELALAIVEGEGANKSMIGPKILPDFPINKRTAHLVKALLKDTLALRSIASNKFIRTPGAKYERAVATLSDETLSVTLRGLELSIPNETQLDYNGYLAIEQLFAGRFGNDITAITKEVLIAAALLSTSTFGSATNSTVAYTLANLSTISFIADVIASTRRLKAKGEAPPYKLVASGPVLERVRQAATVQAYAAGTLKAGMEATLAQITASLREFGIDEILSGDGYYNTAADGATPSLSQIWSNTYIWIGKPGTVSGMSETDGVMVPIMGGVGVNAYWEGWAGGKPNADAPEVMDFPGGNFVESYYEKQTDSVICRVKLSATPFIGNARAGDLIATQWA